MNRSQFYSFFFYTFLFLLPFQTVYLLREPYIQGIKWQYGTIGIFVVDIFLIGMLGFFSWKKSLNDLRTRKRGDGFLFLLLLWSYLSIFWSEDKILAFFFSFQLSLAVWLYLVVRSSKKIDIKKSIFVLLVVGVLQSGIGITQFLTQRSIESSFLGMTAYQVSEAGSSVLKIDAGRFLRAYGTFSHPNILGVFLVVILLLGVGYYVRHLDYKKAWKTVWEIFFLLSSIIFLFLGSILTFSRMAWIGGILGFCILSLSVLYSREHIVWQKFFKILLLFGGVSIVFGTLLAEQIFPRFDSQVIAREGSVTERLQSVHDAQLLLKNGNIIFGTGAGNFTARMFTLDLKRPVWSIQPVHNVPLLVVSELGIVGLFLFLGFLLSVCTQVFSMLDTARLSFIFLGAFCAVIPSFFFDHFLWSSHFGILFFFLFLGLIQREQE